MDRITLNLMSEFASENGFEDIPESDQFEHFANFAVVAREHLESFSPSEVHVGAGGTTGIDGIAILVNGSLVTEEDEVDDLLARNNYLDVDYVFVQAKTSAGFDAAEIGWFANAVRDFFSDRPRLPQSPALGAKRSISEYLLGKTSKMRSNPTCSLFFVTTGKWIGDAMLQASLDRGRDDLQCTGLFASVRVVALGAEDVQRLYRQTKDAITVEVEFPNKVTLPDIPGVEQAFIGTLPATDFLRLIVDDSGNIRKSVFEDNIRDFQGDTKVNEGIRRTLEQQGSAFAVLNNGITVVCRTLRITGNKAVLGGYQIVNGCQTSHILHDCTGSYDANTVLVPVKLVSTQDDDVVGKIIGATNSQNAVKPEELEALTEFSKRLEAYYRTYSGAGALYYERRSRQWAATKVEKTRVVTIPNQIKAMGSMFLDLPHRVSGYYGTVRERIGDRIFKVDHREIPYYTSALALYRLERLFASKTIDPKFKPLRWFLLMLFRYQVIGPPLPPPLNSPKIEAYCRPLIDALIQTERAAAIYTEVIGTMSHEGLPEINKDTLKTQNLRDKLIEPYLARDRRA